MSLNYFLKFKIMQITITATLTPEQLEILAKAKWYSE